MKPTATGRILIWRGGSLWIGLAGEPTGFHAHHAVQVGLPLEQGRVQFRRPSGRWIPYAAAIVAANEPHAFGARGQQVAQIFIEPESRDGRSLQRRYGAAGVSALATDALASPLAALARAYKEHVEDTRLIACVRTLIAALVGTTTAAAMAPDPRIERALERIRQNLGGTVTLAAVADAAHLSPDRFRHLFREETGVTLRPYILWLRLERSLAAYIAGHSLTEAAHAGGFSDSAHFSRTFKRMFGIAPVSVHPE